MDRATDDAEQGAERGEQQSDDAGLSELDDAARDMAAAGTDEDNRRRWTREGEEEQDTHRSREELERMAYTRGLNPVADSNVQMEEEEREKRKKAAEEQAEAEKRNRQALVENRVYAVGTAAVKFPVANCMAVRCARNALEHAVEAAEKEMEEEERRVREAGEKKVRWHRTREDIQKEEERRLAETVVLAVVVEQALAETMVQAELFADHEEVDTGKIAVMDPHHTVVEGEQLLRLVRESGSILSIPEMKSRILYPYSFGRPSKELIAVLRCTIALIHKESRQRIARESFSVIDSARRDGERARSVVAGPSAEREEPLLPVAHTNRIEIAIDMTGDGDIRSMREEKAGNGTSEERERSEEREE